MKITYDEYLAAKNIVDTYENNNAVQSIAKPIWFTDEVIESIRGMIYEPDLEKSLSAQYSKSIKKLRDLADANEDHISIKDCMVLIKQYC